MRKETIKRADDPAVVVAHYGGVIQTQKRLGLKSRQTIYYWLRRGRLPELRARQVHEDTGGELSFDRSAYE